MDAKALSSNKQIEILRSGSEREKTFVIETIYGEQFIHTLTFVQNQNGSYEDAKDVFQEAFATFLDKIQSSNFELTCKISTYIFAIAKRLFWRMNRKKFVKQKIHFRDAEIQVLEEFKFKFTPIDIEQHDNEEEIKNVDDEQVERLVISMLTHPKFKTCKDVIMDFFFSESKLSMEEIAENNQYANAKVAKNKKSKCLKKLKSIASQISFFKNYKS